MQDTVSAECQSGHDFLLLASPDSLGSSRVLVKTGQRLSALLFYDHSMHGHRDTLVVLPDRLEIGGPIPEIAALIRTKCATRRSPF